MCHEGYATKLGKKLKNEGLKETKKTIPGRLEVEKNRPGRIASGGKKRTEHHEKQKKRERSLLWGFAELGRQKQEKYATFGKKRIRHEIRLTEGR